MNGCRISWALIPVPTAVPPAPAPAGAARWLSQPFDGIVDLRAPCSCPGHRHRVHEMRTAGLVNLRPILFLLPKHAAQLFERRVQLAPDLAQRTQMNRRSGITSLLLWHMFT
jgi:hypothetical protein